MDNQQAVAQKLLQISAIKLSVSQPFTWASGWKSPIYCDNRKILSFPVTRDFVKSEMCDTIFQKYPDTELIAGVATAGIAWGALVADQLKLSFIYVRPKAKEHGLQNQVEGFYEPGKKVVIVEDLVSTGKSSLQVADVLRSSGLEVIGLVSIFNYDFPQASEAFRNAQIPVISLTNYPTLIALAIEKGLVSKDDEDSLMEWRKDPANWRK